jgi:hypothetical protein
LATLLSHKQTGIIEMKHKDISWRVAFSNEYNQSSF